MLHNKTAATILDEAALSARLVADQLGHARPSMTQDVYLPAVRSTPTLLPHSKPHSGAWPSGHRRNDGKVMAPQDAVTLRGADQEVCAR